MLPDVPNLPEDADLIRQYAPRLYPQARWQSRILAGVTGMVGGHYLGAAVGYLAFGWMYGANGAAWLVLAAGTVVGLAAGEAVLEGRLRRKRRAVDRQLQAAPWLLHDVLIEGFADGIRRQRRRILGPQSEWAVARAPLEKAADEANRLRVYWEERMRGGDAPVGIHSQLETARTVESKFRRALQELDARTQTLATFFNQCEARLTALSRDRHDLEAAAKLSQLSDKADVLVADTQASLQAISGQFLADAVRVGEALGDLERFEIGRLAASVEVDDVDAIADKILESSENERETLEQLVRGVSGSVHPLD